MLSSFNLKSSLAVEAAEVDVGAEVVEAVAHVPVADSRPQRLLLARRRGRLRPALPLDQVLAALRLVLAQQGVLLQVPGPQAALLPGRLRKVALAPVRQGKVLPLHSVPQEQVQMSQAAVRRLAK